MIPAELVWYVSDETEAYDVLVYRAMAAEYTLAEALAGLGLTLAGAYQLPLLFLETRWEPFERASLALGI